MAMIGQATTLPELVTPLTDAINRARIEHGVPALLPWSPLFDTASDKALDMAHGGYFDHYSPHLGRFVDQIRAAKLPARSWAENLGLFPLGIEGRAIVDGWLDSPSHREALLSRRYTHVGVGAARARDSTHFVSVAHFAYVSMAL